MADTIVPVQAGDTAERIAARYTIGGAAYGPALVNYNGWFNMETLEPINARTPLASLGITGAAFPSTWLRPGAQTASQTNFGLNYPLLGVPVWLWGAGVALFLAVKR